MFSTETVKSLPSIFGRMLSPFKLKYISLSEAVNEKSLSVSLSRCEPGRSAGALTLWVGEMADGEASGTAVLSEADASGTVATKAVMELPVS